MGVIMACFAEVASQFSEAGGPYLYARTAFGRLTGNSGWLDALPGADRGTGGECQFVCHLSGGILARGERTMAALCHPDVCWWDCWRLINILGARQGTVVSNVFTVAKILAAADGDLGGSGGHDHPSGALGSDRPRCRPACG